MSTLADLISSIASALHSYSGVQEQSTHLTSPAGTPDLTLTVASSEEIKRGIIEVDDELMYVDASTAGSLTVAPYGRGYRGSTATTHSAGTQVAWDPAFPRCEIRKAVDQQVASLFPTLYRVKTTDLPVGALPVGYSLPADCDGVLDVKAQAPGDPYDYWAPVYRYAFDASSPEANGKAINIFEALVPGSTVRVVYRAPFGTFATASDTLASVGLSESHADLILYGVSARLIRFLDPARLQTLSVENLSRAQVVQVGDAGKVANQLYAMYQQRLSEERKRLLDATPSRINFTR